MFFYLPKIQIQQKNNEDSTGKMYNIDRNTSVFCSIAAN